MTDRGKQSWGWTNGTDIHKALGLVRSGFTAELLGHKAAMIHTRHSTTGAVIAENSHPFQIKGIIGVHNGMIYNHAELGRAYPSRNAVVDSEHIFHQLADGLPLSELEGYGAIVYWKDGILHMGRFNNGDMVLAKTDFGWVYASTKESLVDALHMSGLAQTVKFFVKLKEGVLYQLIGDRIVKTHTRLDITRSNSTLTWQNSHQTDRYVPYVNAGFWHRELQRWFATVEAFTKEFPDGEVPEYAPKPPALALPGVTQKKSDAVAQLADPDDGYAKEWGEDEDNTFLAEAFSTEVGICDSCGFMRDVIVMGHFTLCEECFHEGQVDQQTADAEDAELVYEEDYETADNDIFYLSTARMEDPEEEEIMCELCACVLRGDTPVYVCMTDDAFTICRFCHRDEYGTEENLPTVTPQHLN
jgi:glutamine amidotransferase-like protein